MSRTNSKNQLTLMEVNAAQRESPLERELLLHLHALTIPAPAREHRFAPPRRWRFDLAWPELALAVEVEGATYNGGRHTRGTGYHNDLEKYNQAMIDGWMVLRFDSPMIKDGTAARMIADAYALCERTRRMMDNAISRLGIGGPA